MPTYRCAEKGETVEVGPVKMIDLITAVLYRAYLNVRPLTNNFSENVTIKGIN
jgi:hypothetical protein